MANKVDNRKRKDYKKTKPPQNKQNPNDTKNRIRSKIEAEREAIKREKAERIQNAKVKRLERAKILNKRTKHGQPLMKCRMEYLLKQIQDMKSKS